MKHAANVYIKFADGTHIDRTFWEPDGNVVELKTEAETFCQMIISLFKDSDAPATAHKISYIFE